MLKRKHSETDQARKVETPARKVTRSKRTQDQLDFVKANIQQAAKFAPPSTDEYTEASQTRTFFTSNPDPESIEALMEINPEPTDVNLMALDNSDHFVPPKLTYPTDRETREKLYKDLQNVRNYQYHKKVASSRRTSGFQSVYNLTSTILPEVRPMHAEMASPWFGKDKSCPFCPAYPHLFYSYQEFPILQQYPTLRDLVYHVSAYHYPFVNRIHCDGCRKKDPPFVTSQAYTNHYGKRLRLNDPNDPHVVLSKGQKVASTQCVER